MSFHPRKERPQLMTWEKQQNENSSSKTGWQLRRGGLGLPGPGNHRYLMGRGAPPADRDPGPTRGVAAGAAPTQHPKTSTPSTPKPAPPVPSTVRCEPGGAAERANGAH